MSPVIRRLLGYALRHRRTLTLALIASLVSALAGMFAPLVAGRAVDLVVALRLSEVPPYIIAFVLLAVLRGLASFLQGVESRKLAEYVTLDMRVELYRKLQHLPLTYLYREGAGRLVARVMGDVEQVKWLFGFALSGFVGGLILLVFSIASMLSLSPELTAVSLVVLAPSPFIVRRFARKVRLHFEEARRSYARMTTVLRETLVSMIPVRAVGAESHMAKRFDASNEAYAGNMVYAGKMRALAWSTLNFLTLLAVLVALWYGGVKIMERQLTVGDVVALAMYINMISWPITSVGILTVIVERARVAASRVFEVLDTESDVAEDPSAVPLRVERGEVRFEDVWFSYDGRNWVLKGLNLRVKPGEFVAITGPPGGGKSTLAVLLIRLADPQRGRILIDGQDIRKVTIESLRDQVALVHQDVYLFPDTIRNNISYAKPGASEDEVVRAARLARIHDFIVSLPKGYDTVVGERGITLSGGQRQRLALARALLVDPKVIVLDDTTSEIDAETERAVYEALTKHFRGRTLIVITQRPAVLALADRVIVIEDGRVAREIRHNRLGEAE